MEAVTEVEVLRQESVQCCCYPKAGEAGAEVVEDLDQRLKQHDEQMVEEEVGEEAAGVSLR